MGSVGTAGSISSMVSTGGRGGMGGMGGMGGVDGMGGMGGVDGMGGMDIARGKCTALGLHWLMLRQNFLAWTVHNTCRRKPAWDFFAPCKGERSS